MKRKILVLEDEENIRSFLVLNLKRSGYEVIEAETGEIALEKYHENQDIAVAVLDVMLPGIDGYEVCRAMRGAGYQAGVIMLTARTQEADKVTGLMNGADDYVTKPFSVIELAARVDALYRRVSGSPFSEDDVIKSGPFKLNLRAREVLKNGVKIELTQIEYGLLKDAGRVSAEIARLHAETEFEKYRVIQDREFLSDYDKFLLELEEHADAAKAGPQEEKP